MNARSRIFLVLVVLSNSTALVPAAETPGPIQLDAASRNHALQVLRDGMRGDEFWPAIHAAEGLTLAGYPAEVITFLAPRLVVETDDQKRCGIARELVRAGDRSALSVITEIQQSENTHGHVHAAESLFKLREIGDRPAMRRAADQENHLALKLMSAAALSRHGDAKRMESIRQIVAQDDPKTASLAAWVLGQTGDDSDVARLKTAMQRISDPVPRANFEHALALLGNPEGIAALKKNLSSSNDTIRTYAATFAGEARLMDLTPDLLPLLNDRFADARIRAAQSLLVLSRPQVIPFTVQTSAVFSELSRDFCWFHPRVAAIPAHGADGQPAVVMTIQKHLAADDHYSGLYFLRTDDLGKTWTKPIEVPELAWKKGDRNETIAVCDVTPGWLSKSQKLLAIGIKLRYSPQGAQLVDQPRSHECAYAVFDPATNHWKPWKMLAMPDTDKKFFLVAPGCVQWLEKADGTLLIPVYFQSEGSTDYTTTVLHCSFDGSELKYLTHGNELALSGGRGLYEPSLTRSGETFFLTLRNDSAAYVTTSSDGLHYRPIQKWTFDDGQDLGSYNTQAHWLTHHDGLFLCYTRRGASNDHIPRNRAPIFIAQADPKTLTILRITEQQVLPERGVMLGNFGAAAITSQESWVTDAEYIVSDQPHPRGADGTVWLGRVKWLPSERSLPD